MNQTLDIFKNEDIIYHYTKSQIAIEYILFEKKIRLSKRKKSNDPIENSSILKSLGGVNLTKEDDEKGKKQREELDEREKKLQQACFCMNNHKIETNKYEYYGFFKPRMWDQYGDKYKGICLAFDKKELLKDPKIVLKRKICYSSFEDIKESLDFNLNAINQLGYDKSKIEMEKIQNNFLLRKHTDYRDENEYRICTFNDDEYDYLDIEKSIKGIIVFDENLNDFTLKEIEKISKNMGIPILYLRLANGWVDVSKKVPYYESSDGKIKMGSHFESLIIA